jgi:VCBS repeat-containing protein
MDRIDRFLDQNSSLLNSSLLDASRAEWLPVDAPAASRKDDGPAASVKDKEGRREQNVRRALVTTREKQRALADATGTAPRLPAHPAQIASGGMIQSGGTIQSVSGDAAALLGVLGTGAGCPAVVSPAVPNNVTGAGLSFPTAALPDLADALPNPVAALAAAADRTATPAPTTAADTAGSETAPSPSMSLTATVTGSSTPTSPTVQNVSVCCGTCGYVNCPMQLMTQSPASMPKLAGQLYGSGSPAAADAVDEKSILGASISQSMAGQIIMPATAWDRSLPAGSNGSLPGGGSGGTVQVGTRVGILSGEVTELHSTQPAPPAGGPTNAIMLENEKPGNPISEWGIDGDGDDNIEGFATDISINHGTTVSFKINTDSTDYRIDIYRLGYYGGDGARLVDTMVHTGLQTQPDPLVDTATGEVDAGNWSVSASWAVPADAVSGVYIAKLTRLDGVEGENQIPFIVRDDSSTSDIVFQTSDETWQAYNGWGGANLYGGDGPATGQGAGRAYAVSYNRPIDDRGFVGTYAGPQDYLFGAEYSAIYWLEENGYDVSYMAGVDADRLGSLLLNHKTYVDAGHDEYWSGQQRANVEAARDAGVNLEFWSGNEVYWRTEWGNALSSDATPYRTLITYKDTWANAAINPDGQWTGTFRDPRFDSTAPGGGDPENSLTGQLFQVDDGTPLGAITVPYADSTFRFWANTSVADLQPGQTATLTQNYLGYEWDEAPDNGFDPAGLVRLSSTTENVNSLLLDYGNTTGSGTATHSLTLYRAPSGALVFGAGTVYWSWGLSDSHDNEPTPADPNVQQAMVNLFADMGIQPTTLQSGLIKATGSTDTIAPTSVINAIAPFAAQSTVTITGTASDVGGVVAGVEISTDDGASWHPVTGDGTWTYSWTPQVAGTYTILSRAVDDSVNLETPSAGRTVTLTGPSYTTLFPGSATPAIVNTTDASAVELGVKFESSVAGTVSGIRFFKSDQDTGVHTGELWSSTGVELATVTFTNESDSGWQTATFSNPVTITPGAIYIASYHTNVGHYSNTGNYFTTNVVSGALTALAAGNGVFTYGSTSLFPTSTFQSTNFWVDVMFNPATGTTNLPPTAVNDIGPAVTRDTAVTITAASLLANDSDPNGDALTITAVNAATHGTVVLNTTNNIITFTPDAGYTGPAGFSYTISDGHSGTASANVSLTVSAPGTLPVSLFSTANTPTLTSLNDGSQLEVGVKFTSSVAGQVTALKFYRSASDTGSDLLDLWSSTGTKLATATFSNTTASGWQTVTLSAPVTITANTTYIASYHTTGAYVATENFFTTALSSGNLTATATANGVYSYGGSATAGIFPTSTFGATNYFADVVFNPTVSNDTAPTAVADTATAVEKGGIANGSGGSPGSGNVLTNDTDPDTGDTKTVTAVTFGAVAGTLGTALAGAHGSLTLSASGAFTYTVNDTDAAVQALRLSTNTLTDVFNYTMSDTAGATSSSTLTVTIQGANDAPVLAVQTGGQSAVVGSAFSLVLPAGTFTDVDSGDTLSYTATAADGTALPAWLTFNPTTRTFSGTPATANIGTLSVKVTGTDLGGLAASETFSLAVTATPNTAPTAVADTATAVEKGGIANGSGGSPGSGNVLTNDTDPDTGDTKTVTAVTFGAVAGTLGAALTGAHGSLTLSASGAFTYTVNDTDAAVQALRLSTNTLTDVFNYTMSDTAGATSSSTLTVTIQGANDAPVLAAQTANQNATVGSAFSLVLPAGTFTDVDSGDTLSYTATAADGTALPAWLAFNATTRTFSGTPAAANVGTISVKATATDLGGLATSETFSLTVGTAPATVSLFSAANTPTLTSLNDGGAQLEVGVKFTSSVAGQVTALKFYRSASDTGTDVLDLWASTGTKLASASFTTTTASGWQTVTLATPVTIAANTTYIASYHTTGAYVATSNFFTAPVTSGPLTAPSSTTAGGNGVFAYGGSASTGLFPTNTFGAANYYADVVFRPQIV